MVVNPGFSYELNPVLLFDGPAHPEEKSAKTANTKKTFRYFFISIYLLAKINMETSRRNFKFPYEEERVVRKKKKGFFLKKPFSLLPW